jgi:hypothetical protein
MAMLNNQRVYIYIHQVDASGPRKNQTGSFLMHIKQHKDVFGHMSNQIPLTKQENCPKIHEEP